MTVFRKAIAGTDGSGGGAISKTRSEWCPGPNALMASTAPTQASTQSATARPRFCLGETGFFKTCGSLAAGWAPDASIGPLDPVGTRPALPRRPGRTELVSCALIGPLDAVGARPGVPLRPRRTEPVSWSVFAFCCFSRTVWRSRAISIPR